jgi:hypothetical protein
MDALNSALRNFLLDETMPKPPKCLMEEEKMEIDSAAEDQQQQQTAASSSSAAAQQYQIKPIELTTRLLRRDIPGANQILNKFHFL